MTEAQYRRLKVGDRVTLGVRLHDYTCGHFTDDGKAYIPAGTVGVVAAVNVAPPTHRKGRQPRPFACIDFPAGIRFEDHRGNPVEHWGAAKAKGPAAYRCAARAEELE